MQRTLADENGSGVRTGPKSTLAQLQNNAASIRNICVIAHVDHGLLGRDCSRCIVGVGRRCSRCIVAMSGVGWGEGAVGV